MSASTTEKIGQGHMNDPNQESSEYGENSIIACCLTSHFSNKLWYQW
jgi:hypothetical protein